jgi:hypothetical protein
LRTAAAAALRRTSALHSTNKRRPQKYFLFYFLHAPMSSKTFDYEAELRKFKAAPNSYSDDTSPASKKSASDKNSRQEAADAISSMVSSIRQRKQDAEEQRNTARLAEEENSQDTYVDRDEDDDEEDYAKFTSNPAEDFAKFTSNPAEDFAKFTSNPTYPDREEAYDQFLAATEKKRKVDSMPPPPPRAPKKPDVAESAETGSIVMQAISEKGLKSSAHYRNITSTEGKLRHNLKLIGNQIYIASLNNQYETLFPTLIVDKDDVRKALLTQQFRLGDTVPAKCACGAGVKACPGINKNCLPEKRVVSWE